MNPLHVPPISVPPVTGATRLQGNRVPAGKNVIYFTPFRSFSHPQNAREMVENTLFYLSAQRFDVFTCFSSHMSHKPVILQESARRIVERFGEKNSVVIKELGAGYGESMAILLGEIKNLSLQVYNKLAAYASDGFLPVIERMRSSSLLAPYFGDRRLTAVQEDLMAENPCLKRADYVRISYTLTDMPEDIIHKENGQFYVAKVRGYVVGNEDFVSDKEIPISATRIAAMLESGNPQGIIDLGLDIRDIQPRIGFEIEYEAIDYSAYTDGGLVQTILENITAGVATTDFRMGLNAAQAIERIIGAHMAAEAGATMEVLDLWTAEILPGMPAPYTGLKLTSINSVNYPFVREYMQRKGIPVTLQFEDWKDYVGLKEPYIYLSHFAKWLRNSPTEVLALLGRTIPVATVGRIVSFLEETMHIADMVLYAEKDTHPAIIKLKEEGFTLAEIELLFSSQKFPEPVKSKSRGFYGIYQVVTLRRK